MIGYPPLNCGSVQIKPIYDSFVSEKTLVSDVGGSGVYAHKIVRLLEYPL